MGKIISISSQTAVITLENHSAHAAAKGGQCSYQGAGDLGRFANCLSESYFPDSGTDLDGAKTLASIGKIEAVHRKNASGPIC